MSASTFVGFTPAPDCIRDAIDALAALVFGAVYRFSQQEKGVCTASVETIAKRVGIGQTATRVRLGKLVEGGWLIAIETPGRPTTYRDSGKWTVKIVGENGDLTPTRNGGVPQRETEGSAYTPTRNGGVPQREALPKILSKKLEQDIAPFGAEAASPMTCTPSAVAVNVDLPPMPPAPTFTDTVLAHLEASVSGASLRRKAGTYVDGVGNLLGILGRLTNDDAAIACDYWTAYVEAAGDYLPSPHNWPAKFGAWAKKNKPPRATVTTRTDSREPVSRYMARHGTSVSDLAAWTPEARALYPEDAAIWAPVEVAQ